MSIFPLTAKDVSVRVRGKRLIEDVSFELKKGGVTALIGPNGAGKTTLMRALHGVQRLSGGTLDWAVPARAAQNAQGFVFQHPVMLRRSVIENLAYPLRLHGVDRRSALAQAQDWAQKIGLGEKMTQMAPSLSGGEQLKLALARALIRNPELVFLDEPSAALDGRSVREFEEAILAATQQGVTFMLCTHDMGQAKRLSQHVIFMLRGQIQCEAPATEFFNTPPTSEAAGFLRGDILE